MDYIYGKLNKLVEAQKYNFASSDSTVIISNLEANNIDLTVNTTQIITLKQVVKDIDPKDDPIKYYSLYAYNPNTKQFDIKIGDEIKLDLSFADDAANKVQKAWVKVGEYQKFEYLFLEDGNPDIDENTGLQKIKLFWKTDENGNDILDEHGNKIPIMVPQLQEIITEVNAPGQLILSQIPASAIVDTEITIDPITGLVKEEQIQSILDGNAGGEVY